MKKKSKLISYIIQYGFQSIFTKNILFSSIIILISFGIILSHTYKNSLDEFSYVSHHITTGRADKAATAYDASLKTISELIYSVNMNKNILLLMNNAGDSEDTSIYDEIMNYLSVISSNHRYIDSISVYFENKNTLISTASCMEVTDKSEIYYKKYYDNTTPAYITYSEKGHSLGEMTFLYKNIGSKNSLLGFTMIKINIMDLFESIGIPVHGNSNDMFFYLDSSDKIIAASSSKYIGENFANVFLYEKDNSGVLSDGKKYFFEIQNAYLGGKYVYLCGSELSDVLKHQLKVVSLITILYMLIASILLSFFITSRNSKPILEILSYLQELPFNLGKKTNETSFIKESILTLEHERLNSTEQMKEKLLLLNKFQLIAYQNQMNPHFLCNTLETLKWMAFDYEDDDFSLSTSIENLSMIAKYSLNNNDYIVPLHTELEYTKTYVKILELRYKNNINFNWNIEDGLNELKVIKFCIQPFIENSVQHGMKRDKLPLTINISIYIDGYDLVIKVSDNGIGIESDLLMSINKNLAQSEIQNKSKGVGISNTNARIKLIYGTEYGVSVESEYKKGTTVTIKMNAQ